MTTKRKRITLEEKRHIEHLYFRDGLSINNIVKTQNLGWGVTVVTRVVKEAKKRRAEKEREHRALAVLTDKEWSGLMYGPTYPDKWDDDLVDRLEKLRVEWEESLPVSPVKQAELKELRAIRKLLETLLERTHNQEA